LRSASVTRLRDSYARLRLLHYLQKQGEVLSHTECATRSIKSRIHTEPRMVMTVSRPHKPKVVYFL
jgi:hypothetical protein